LTSQFKRLLVLIKSYAAILLFWRKPIRFVIFSQGRTGSTLLYKLLENQKDIQCEGEVLNRYKNAFNWKVLFPFIYLDGRSKMNNAKFYGFKIKIYQITGHLDMDPHYFLQNLINRGYKIIYLKRSNILKQAVSTLVANETGVYHETKQVVGNLNRLETNKETLEHYMFTRAKFLREEDEALKGIPALHLEYEEDLEQSATWEKTIIKCSKYLGIPTHDVKTDRIDIFKNAKKPLSEFVVNYKELKDQFADSEYDKFFT